MGKEKDLLRCKNFISCHKWKFAKTMPQWPHQYTLLRDADYKEFVWFVKYIRKHGYRKEFNGCEYTYLDIDGFAYWTMGWPVERTILINMAVGGGCGGKDWQEHVKESEVYTGREQKK